MNESLIFACLILFVASLLYCIALSLTRRGRVINASPDLAWFLTALGLSPVVATVFVLGPVSGLELLLLLASAGLPFVARGAWRIATTYEKFHNQSRWIPEGVTARRAKPD